MNYDGKEIVELLVTNHLWSWTTLADADFVCIAMNYDKAKHIRKLEGSLDNGVTWKTWYEGELEKLNISANDIQWRVKEE